MFDYVSGMKIEHPMSYLWDNLAALMHKPPDHPGLLDRVQEKTGVGRGIIQRIRSGPSLLKEGERPSVELKSIVSLAEAFSVEVWELLRPGSVARGHSRQFVVDSLVALTDKLSDQELVKLTEQIRLAVASRDKGETPGSEAGEVKVYFALDRRTRDIHVDADQRGSTTWTEPRDSITENIPPKGRIHSKKGALG